MIDGKNAVRLKFRCGEKLEMHSHDHDSYHDVRVTSGSVRVHGKGWQKSMGSGESLVLSDDQMEHEIVALSDDTEVLNVYRLPMPSHSGRIAVGWFNASE